MHSPRSPHSTQPARRPSHSRRSGFQRNLGIPTTPRTGTQYLREKERIRSSRGGRVPEPPVEAGTADPTESHLCFSATCVPGTEHLLDTSNDNKTELEHRRSRTLSRHHHGLCPDIVPHCPHPSRDGVTGPGACVTRRRAEKDAGIVRCWEPTTDLPAPGEKSACFPTPAPRGNRARGEPGRGALQPSESTRAPARER